jgi:lipoprotein signal peptidase
MILTLGSLKTAIFNVADAAVVSGLLLLAISNLPWFSRRVEDGFKS